MSEHVIQNAVPTPEQMAEMLGVSPARVKTLRRIMRSPSAGSFLQRNGTTGDTATKRVVAYKKAAAVGKGKVTVRAKSKAR